jgi:hypothetical protein
MSIEKFSDMEMLEQYRVCPDRFVLLDDEDDVFK